MSAGHTVSLITVGCGRNHVDSEELAARLVNAGWQLADPAADPSKSDVVLVNTCGFIEPARTDSIDTLLAVSDSDAKVVAVGCLAERYGTELAAAMPEIDTVLAFDDYPEIGERLDDVMRGRRHPARIPRARSLPPIAQVPRHRLGGGPVAPLTLASGCDRRCSFCAIPSFRGAFRSRHPDNILAEADWLAGRGVREIILVSENSTAYGKDLGDLRALEKLLPRLASIVGRVRVSYLQPAELRPSLIETIATTPGVAAYFDLSFQHASGSVLRRMRRLGDLQRFLELLASIRSAAPDAGVRSDFIVGFPGESEEDFAQLQRFLEQARLDAVGVFGYSDEKGTEACAFDGKVDPILITERATRLALLAEELCGQRAEERVGSIVEVLIGDRGHGWAAHQTPEIDGTVTISGSTLRTGDLVHARLTAADGLDFRAEIVTVVGAIRH